MANALGQRILYRWQMGECTLATLDAALRVGWIDQDEYDAALEATPGAE